MQNSSSAENIESFECEDPLDILCEIPRPFYPLREVSDLTLCPIYHSNREIQIPIVKVRKGVSKSKFIQEAISENLKNHTRRIRELSQDELEDEAATYDPYHELGNLSYTTRNVPPKNVLAIHAIFTVYDFPSFEGEFHYLCIDAGYGGWVKFIQDKYPQSYGYGMTLEGQEDWNYKMIDVRRFQPLYGNSTSGDIRIEKDWLVNLILQKTGKLNMVTCESSDGGILTLTSQVITGLSLLKSRTIIPPSDRLIQRLSFEEKENYQDSHLPFQTDGGIMIVKLEDSSTEIIGQILYLCSRCFESITIYKPAVIEPYYGTRYLICKNFIDATEVLPILRQIDENTSSILQDVPSDFHDWLFHINNKLGSKQDMVSRMILLTPKAPKTPARDASRMMTLLDLKGTTGVNVY